MDIRAIMAKLNVHFVLGFVAIVSVVYSQAPREERMVVEKGSNVTFECSTHEVGRCTLLHSNTDVVVDRHGAKKGRAEIINNQTCIINIHSVQLTDTDAYTCQVGEGKVIFYLTVFVTPNEPEIFYNGEMKMNNSKNVVHIIPGSDESAQIECRSYGGYPNGTINWYVDNELQSGNVKSDVREENGLFNVRSFTSVRFEDILYTSNGPDSKIQKEVRCEVEHLAYDNTRKVVGAIFGKPYSTRDVQLTFDKPGDFLLVGSREVTCEADGLPVPKDFRIMREGEVDGEFVEVEKTATYNVTTPGVYRCEARNVNILGDLMEAYAQSGPVTFLDPSKAGHRTAEGNAGSIVGIVLGAVLVIAIVVIVVAVLYRKEKLCFAPGTGNQQFSPNPGNVENGVKNVYDNEMTNTEKDQKKDGVKGDQNENTKPKEVVYAQLDLTQKTNNGNSRPKSPEEKTEYAQLTFQPKENQV